MPVCKKVKTITPRCRGRPDALLHEAEYFIRSSTVPRGNSLNIGLADDAVYGCKKNLKIKICVLTTKLGYSHMYRYFHVTAVCLFVCLFVSTLTIYCKCVRAD